jgi:hypothetical protein
LTRRHVALARHPSLRGRDPKVFLIVFAGPAEDRIVKRGNEVKSEIEIVAGRMVNPD